MSIVNKNDIIEAEIDGIGYEGEGIAHLGGYTVFIRYALPGEKVRAVIILAKPTFAVGKLLSVLNASADRAEPFCPVYYKCGGCGLQHMSYEAQLSFKARAVKDTFYKAAKLEVEPDEVVPSPEIRNYRNKMSLPIRGETAAAGFFATGTHRIVEINECPIQFEGNGALIRAFLDFLHREKISGYNETTHKGVVRHLTARKLGDFYTITAVANGNYRDKLKGFDKILREMYGGDYAYYINYNTGEGNAILGRKSEFIGGFERETEIDGLKISVHPQSFFQVNDGVRELLYREAAEETQASEIIDAYSGAGVFSAMLAKKAKSVTAVEIEPEAVRSAQKLMDANGIKNVKLVCGDCAEKIPELISGKVGIVLDPPRAGCDRRVLEAVANAAPEKITYISCNPATLARDCAFLIARGYKIQRLTPFDMFPHSPNVENLCVLEYMS